MTLRPDAYYDLQSIIVDGLNRIAKENNIYKCCWNCLNLDIANDQCGKYKIKPPIKIITLGCESWEDKDKIPF